MRQKHRAQTGISGKHKLRYGPRFLLVPSELETDAKAILTPATAQFPVAADTAVNTFRGSVLPIVEPMLSDNNALIYYSIVDPRLLRGVVHAFQRGYWRGGKRRSYFDPKTNSRHWQIEGRFAVALVNCRR